MMGYYEGPAPETPTTECQSCGTFVHRWQGNSDGTRRFITVCSWCSEPLASPQSDWGAWVDYLENSRRAKQAQQPPRRISRIGTNENQRPEGPAPTERVRPSAFGRCSACGDQLPPGALFCIACGKAVEHTGPTKKL